MSKKNGRAGRMIFYIILLFSLCIFIFAISQIGGRIYTERQGEKIDRELEKAVSYVETEKSSEASSEEVSEDQLPIQVDFEMLKQEYPGVMGWIYLPDSEINYPIMQSKDNDEYLSHMPDGKSNPRGSIFMDCHNQLGFRDDNTIIYGHHMQNGTMFGGLEYYKEQEYYNEHPYMYILTEDKNYRLEVFAAFVTNVESDVYAVNFNEEGKISMLQNAVRQSDIKTNPRVTSNDRIVTLSTCAYVFDNARYVVLGVLKGI